MTPEEWKEQELKAMRDMTLAEAVAILNRKLDRGSVGMNDSLRQRQPLSDSVPDLLARPAWHENAACSGLGNELFYPGRVWGFPMRSAKLLLLRRCAHRARSKSSAWRPD